MTCESCPHMKSIRDALKPCESCDRGSHHGASHVQATEYTLSQQKKVYHVPDTGVTNLSPDDEDKLRKAMSSLFGLDPINLLLVQHLFAGKTLAAFGKALEAVAENIGRYRESSRRSTAHAKKNAIERIFPQIRPVFKHALDPNARPSRNADEIGHLCK